MASLALSIGLISFLNRREELTVPNWPRESINTGMALFCAVVTPRMWPIKQLSFTLAPTVPIQITLLAVVTFRPAPLAQADIAAAGVIVRERSRTDGRVCIAGGVAKKRI